MMSQSRQEEPVYTKRRRRRCYDASDTAVIENNGVTPE